MGNETLKAHKRRLDAGYFDRYFLGRGIDIGCSTDALIGRGLEVDEWDWPQGDAQFMRGVADATYDFVYSSHCLEHINDPFEALKNWWRILKPNGYLFVVVPDENLYEQGVFPSRFNGDHKHTFRIGGYESWSAKSVDVSSLPLAINIEPECRIIKIELIDSGYDYNHPNIGNVDQSGGDTEVGIEFIFQKRSPEVWRR